MGDRGKPFDVAEQKQRALVRRHAPGVAEDRFVQIQRDAGAPEHHLDQLGLGLAVSLPDRLVRHRGDFGQRLRVEPPFRQIGVEKRRHRIVGPGQGVNAIGDGMDLMARKHLS